MYIKEGKKEGNYEIIFLSSSFSVWNLHCSLWNDQARGTSSFRLRQISRWKATIEFVILQRHVVVKFAECKCLRWCIRHEKHIVILFVPFLCQNIVRMNIQRSLLDSSTLVQRVIYSDELYRTNLNESILESDKTRWRNSSFVEIKRRLKSIETTRR